MVPSTRTALQVTSTFMGTFQKKIWPAPEKSKNVPKTANEGYKYTLLYFSVARDPDGMGCLLGTWDVIGKESNDLERIYGCIYVHFEAILGFTRNKQMRRSKAFRGNVNGAKYPRNVTSHVGFPTNVSRKYGHARRSPKMSQKQPILKGYNTRF